MPTKKDFVKDYVFKLEHRIVTVNFIHQTLTGVRGGVRWHKEVLNVSRSTVKRALDELAQEGAVEAYYYYGHCYDELKYKKLLSHKIVRK